MFNYFRKYRHFSAIGLMAFYMFGGLQFSVIECLHLLSHTGDLVKGNYEKHHLHSHQFDHQHTVLNVLNTQVNDDRQESFPVNETADLSAKKFPQLIYSNQICLGFLVKIPQPVFADAHILDGIEPATPFPPPKS